MSQTHLNVEGVKASINQISILIDEIKVRNDKFMSLLKEKNEQTQNKFPLTKALENLIQQENRKFEDVVNFQSEIRQVLDAYEKRSAEFHEEGVNKLMEGF